MEIRSRVSVLIREGSRSRSATGMRHPAEGGIDRLRAGWHQLVASTSTLLGGTNDASRFSQEAVPGTPLVAAAPHDARGVARLGRVLGHDGPGRAPRRGPRRGARRRRIRLRGADCDLRLGVRGADRALSEHGGRRVGEQRRMARGRRPVRMVRCLLLRRRGRSYRASFQPAHGPAPGRAGGAGRAPGPRPLRQSSERIDSPGARPTDGPRHGRRDLQPVDGIRTAGARCPGESPDPVRVRQSTERPDPSGARGSEEPPPVVAGVQPALGLPPARARQPGATAAVESPREPAHG